MVRGDICARWKWFVWFKELILCPYRIRMQSNLEMFSFLFSAACRVVFKLFVKCICRNLMG